MTVTVAATLASVRLTNYIKSHIEDLWCGTFLQGYVHLGNTQKGVFGEMFAKEYLIARGFAVSGRLDKDTSYDLIVNGYKVEVKFSVAHTHTNKKTGNKKLLKDTFTMNHVAVGKDYDRLLFIGINPDLTARIAWFEKSDIKKMIKDETYFGNQQGGKEAKNDDYMVAAKNLMDLINSKYAKSLDEWGAKPSLLDFLT